MVQYTEEQKQKLIEIWNGLDEEDIYYLKKAREAYTIDMLFAEKDVNRVVDALTTILAGDGFDKHGDINDFGLELEELIDDIYDYNGYY